MKARNTTVAKYFLNQSDFPFSSAVFKDSQFNNSEAGACVPFGPISPFLQVKFTVSPLPLISHISSYTCLQTASPAQSSHFIKLGL